MRRSSAQNAEKSVKRKERKEKPQRARRETFSPQGTQRIWDYQSAENAFQCWWLDGETRGPSTVLGCRLAPLRMTRAEGGREKTIPQRKGKTIHHRGTERIGVRGENPHLTQRARKGGAPGS